LSFTLKGLGKAEVINKLSMGNETLFFVILDRFYQLSCFEYSGFWDLGLFFAWYCLPYQKDFVLEVMVVYFQF